MRTYSDLCSSVFDLERQAAERRRLAYLAWLEAPNGLPEREELASADGALLALQQVISLLPSAIEGGRRNV